MLFRSRRIARRVHACTTALAASLEKLGYRLVYPNFFDTLAVEVPADVLPRIIDVARAKQINLRTLTQTRIGVAFDETVTDDDLTDVVEAFAAPLGRSVGAQHAAPLQDGSRVPESLARTTPFCTHPVFNTHHSETEMLRYLKRLEDRDLSLTAAMIPLGSCTMKLNATTEIYTLSLHDALPISRSGPDWQSLRRDRKSTRLNSSH